MIIVRKNHRKGNIRYGPVCLQQHLLRGFHPLILNVFGQAAAQIGIDHIVQPGPSHVEMGANIPGGDGSVDISRHRGQQSLLPHEIKTLLLTNGELREINLIEDL